jgi:hypothetical protein
VNDPGDHFARPSQQVDDARARSFDTPARCWLWDNGYATTSDGDDSVRLAGYMDGGREQEYECNTLRGEAFCAFHNPETCPHGWTGSHCAESPINKEARMSQGQGADQVAHLTYYDKPTQLSFVWDGTRGSEISVSHGGYAEPEFTSFTWTHSTNEVEDNLNDIKHILTWFQNACERYVRENYGVPALVTAFQSGLVLDEDPSESVYYPLPDHSAARQAFMYGTLVRRDFLSS